MLTNSLSSDFNLTIVKLLGKRINHGCSSLCSIYFKLPLIFIEFYVNLTWIENLATKLLNILSANYDLITISFTILLISAKRRVIWQNIACEGGLIFDKILTFGSANQRSLFSTGKTPSGDRMQNSRSIKLNAPWLVLLPKISWRPNQERQIIAAK